MAFLLIPVSLDTDIPIMSVQKISFGRPGASTFAPWGPFWPLGDTLGHHRRSRKDTQGSRITFSLMLKLFGEFIIF